MRGWQSKCCLIYCCYLSQLPLHKHPIRVFSTLRGIDTLSSNRLRLFNPIQCLDTHNLQFVISSLQPPPTLMRSAFLHPTFLKPTSHQLSDATAEFSAYWSCTQWELVRRGARSAAHKTQTQGKGKEELRGRNMEELSGFHFELSPSLIPLANSMEHRRRGLHGFSQFFLLGSC